MAVGSSLFLLVIVIVTIFIAIFFGPKNYAIVTKEVVGGFVRFIKGHNRVKKREVMPNYDA